jgi:electron transfer flavoprotein beta subunit
MLGFSSTEADAMRYSRTIWEGCISRRIDSMNILVLVKQVPDTEAIIRAQSDTELDIENKYALNFFDEFAVEEALRINEKLGEGKVTVVTLGSKKAADALRRGIAMGADEAFQIEDPALERVDGYATAKTLATFIESRDYDLILCGKQAIDNDSGAVGPALAQLLGIPYLTSIVELEIAADKKGARAAREIEGGREIVTCPIPALFTAQKGLNEPRIPQVAGVMKAMKAQIEKIDLEALGLSPEAVTPKTKIAKYYPPQKRPPVKMIEDEFPKNIEVLVKILREKEKVI